MLHYNRLLSRLHWNDYLRERLVSPVNPTSKSGCTLNFLHKIHLCKTFLTKFLPFGIKYSFHAMVNVYLSPLCLTLRSNPISSWRKRNEYSRSLNVELLTNSCLLFRNQIIFVVSLSSSLIIAFLTSNSFSKSKYQGSYP